MKRTYGPFRSEETYNLIDWKSGLENIRDVDNVLEEAETPLDQDTYKDLTEIYGEEKIDLNPSNHLADIEDGIGCTEIWEKLSEQRKN